MQKKKARLKHKVTVTDVYRYRQSETRRISGSHSRTDCRMCREQDLAGDTYMARKAHAHVRYLGL